MRRNRITMALASLLAWGSVTLLHDGRADAQSAHVLHDIEGMWQADASRQMQCYRAGTDVTCVMVNQGFSHKLHVAYVTPSALEGMVTRRNRANGCVTHMHIAIALQSRTSFGLAWRALDSNCDLSKGQSAADPAYHRVQ